LRSREITRKRQYLIKPKIAQDLSPFCEELTGHRYDNLMKHGYASSEAYRLIAKHYGSRKKVYAGWGSDNTTVAHQAKMMRHDNTFSTNYLDIAFLYGIKNGFESFSLGKALKREGLEFIGEPHSGIDDAYNTALLYLHCIL
jgi:inhibitor of KinA sporulation pathway (predicted exonuclease)